SNHTVQDEEANLVRPVPSILGTEENLVQNRIESEFIRLVGSKPDYHCSYESALAILHYCGNCFYESEFQTSMIAGWSHSPRMETHLLRYLIPGLSILCRVC